MYGNTEYSLLSYILDEVEEKHGKLTGRSSRDFVTRLSTNFSVLRDLFMSFGGLPMIYSGDELEQCNDSSYQKDPVIRI